MPSASVSWSGQCTDHEAQKDLCQKLGELAELSHSYFEEPKPVIKYFDQTIEGEVLLSGYLFGDDETIPQTLKVVQCKSEEEQSADLFALQTAGLYGIEFRLYDGRRFYSGDDRISFVFLRMSDCPELDGRIVYVEDREECKKYYNPIIKGADWYLERPNIRLRYYCEVWMDWLLGWVKYFYINDFDYWRYQRLSGYDELLQVVERLGDGLDAGNLMLLWLKHRFKEEVEEWTGTAREAREFWDAVDKTFKKEDSN